MTQEILRKTTFFKDFSDEQMQRLIEKGKINEYPGHCVLFSEGDIGEYLYWILTGKVKVYARDDEGKENLEINSLTVGDFFGEMALVEGKIRSASIVCVETTTFFMLARKDFLAFATESPQLIISLVEDINQKMHKSNQKLTNFYKELQHRQRIEYETELERHHMISRMVTEVAHEMNTPIGIVNGATSLITDQLKPNSPLLKLEQEEEKSAVEIIQEATALIQSNILKASDLIQQFRYTSVSQIVASRESVIFLDYLKELLDLFKIDTKLATLSFEMSHSLENPSELWTGYPGYLFQILSNLVTNIQRYAYPDNEAGKVKITISEEKDQKCFETKHYKKQEMSLLEEHSLYSRGETEKEACFVITVQDFGKGIPEKNLSRVFDAFFTTGRGSGGTGLGLAIVYNLVTKGLNGNIEAQSEIGKGTTFTLIFPKNVPEEEVETTR